MELFNRLREIRIQKKFTQESLADAVGVTRQTIIAIEKRRFIPSTKLAFELARILDVSIDDLFWLENRKGGVT